ncbi:MAG: hypothetical protein K5859_07010 [Atopobiaceae bacterium]|nr:hypothetical protein [Atopobiaceae bacterium]
MKKAVPALAIALTLALAACGWSHASEPAPATPDPVEAPEHAQDTESDHAATPNDLPQSAPDPGTGPDSKPTTDDGGTVEDLIDWGISTWEELSGEAQEQLENRRSATPKHARPGDWVEATENLSVSVVSAAPGPYDHLDGTPTTMVTVRMRNTSDHTVVVKASNWDADATNGIRVDHKIVIMDEGHRIIASSFTVARISPGATYEAVVYFDGELVSVIYEPHWMVSAENEYIYFDL